MINPYEIIDRRLSAIEQVLQELRQQNGTQTAPDEVGGIELARQVTRLSAARIYTLVSKRQIPHMKRGNRLTFRRTQLLAWLDEGDRKTMGGLDA
ncbi:helix-turn-helix domain-containing protein [Spirosoma utsteinense]|uniref:DNA-binding IscR family transcriptional regulator n=1 Tax=Spirosoma utsteinense TaxID=2585773 RepID=A0ABR6WB50_9BACT|nr:helix-turn-helix domain-containing protein [Spirosoma utsteinense]MBC3786482.1 DNA-binding IscR family transcriptional regulator [Spirosoma utsteinense]MBC3793805.1 DNA-binding IscR family transcriptional regulator [Spirosoma utsteinense]